MHAILFIQYITQWDLNNLILYRTLKNEMSYGLVTIWVYYKINTTALLSLSLSLSLSHSEYNIIYSFTILLYIYIISYKTIVFNIVSRNRWWHYIIGDGQPQLYYYSFPSHVSTSVYGRLTTSIVISHCTLYHT